MATIRQNLDEVRDKIKEAVTVSGRKYEDITLVAVTKTYPASDIEEAIEAGVTDIGENKAQEILEKFPLVKEKVNWHFIGHLQKNKVKYIIDKVAMIHSVESKGLAEEISKKAVSIGKVMPVLLEVNVSGEESKFGLSPDNVLTFIKEIKDLPGIEIKGLMTMAPYLDNPEETRPVFKSLKALAGKIREQNITGVSMDCLSMGMTNDYWIAIEEGATHVRVGTAIFGKRNYM